MNTKKNATEKFYIITTKDTVLDENGVLTESSNVRQKGYKTKRAAVKALGKLLADKKDECIDEHGYEDYDIDTSTNDDGTYQVVNCGSNTYEFTAVEITL